MPTSETPATEDVFGPELVSLEPVPETKEACIERLLDIAVDAGRVEDRETALDALLEREAETTTGVGKGIGIPHAKTDAVDEPTLVFVRSEDGVDFGAMDGEPAHLLFMILVPSDGAEDHLSLLSSLSRGLMHDELREALYDAEEPQAVVDVVTEAVS